MLTKKTKLEQYDKLASDNTMYMQLVSDMHNGVEPTAIETVGHGGEKVQGRLYRPMAGHGGIIVLKYWITGTGGHWDVQVHGLEQLKHELRDNHSEYTVNLRAVLERLTIARNHAIDTKEHAIIAGTV